MSSERFPFLAHWKARGLHTFPDIPFRELVRVRFEKERHALHEHLARSPFFCLLPEEHRQVVLKHAEEKLYQDVERHLLAALERKIRAGLIERGRALLQAERQARLRGDPLEIKPPKGGGVTLTPAELVTLKIVHQEMVLAIKEARRASDLPLKATPHDPDRSRNLSLTSQAPWLSELFDEQELPLLIRHSPSQCALTIMARRLKFSLRYSVTPRTLKDWLKKAPA